MASIRSNAFLSSVPLYRQVQQQIEEAIREVGEHGTPLTDAKLSERFGVSRITVRRAVDELVDAGVLYRIQGVGTFVRHRKLRERLTLNSFLNTWSQGDGKLTVKVGVFERLTANDDFAQQLAIPLGEPLVYIQRLRFQGDTLVAIDDRYLPAKYCRSLTRQDITTSSLVDYLRNREKVKLKNGDMDIEARSASADEARALRIRKGKPILVRRMTFYNMRRKPVFAGISTYRADRVSYRVSVPG